MNPFEGIDAQRASQGYLTIAETLALAGQGNVVFDPFSLLISREVQLGIGNTFYQNVVLHVIPPGEMAIGNNNVFFPGSLLRVSDGRINIGHGNQFGEGNFTAILESHGETLQIGNAGRFIQGAYLNGPSSIGNGSQILGHLEVRHCTLEGGENGQFSDVDQRGAVLKGTGLASNLTVRRGQVINGRQDFAALRTEAQSNYHPKPAD